MSSAALQGKDYRALRRIADVANVTLADVGEPCDQVPAASLAALLASGKIELAVERRAGSVTPAAPPPNRRKGRK